MYSYQPTAPPQNTQPDPFSNEAIRKKYLALAKRLLTIPPLIWIISNVLLFSTFISASKDPGQEIFSTIVGFIAIAAHFLTPVCIIAGIVLLVMRAQIPASPQNPPQS